MRQLNKITEADLKRKLQDAVSYDLIRLNTCNTHVPYDQMSVNDVTFTSFGSKIYVTMFLKNVFIRVITYDMVNDEIIWHVQKKNGLINAIMSSIDTVFDNTFSQIDMLTNVPIDQQTIDAILDDTYK